MQTLTILDVIYIRLYIALVGGATYSSRYYLHHSIAIKAPDFGTYEQIFIFASGQVDEIFRT